MLHVTLALARSELAERIGFTDYMTAGHIVAGRIDVQAWGAWLADGLLDEYRATIVWIADDTAPLPTSFQPGYVVAQITGGVGLPADAMVSPISTEDAASGEYAAVSLTTPLVPGVRNALLSAGMRPIEHVGDKVYICQLESEVDTAALQDQWFLRASRILDRRDRVWFRRFDELIDEPIELGSVRSFDVRWRPGTVENVRISLNRLGVVLAHAGPNQGRVALRIDPELLVRVAEIPSVSALGRTAHARPSLDVARAHLGAPQCGCNFSWTGHGQIVGVMDTGLDATHPDLQGRIHPATVEDVNASADMLDHGTHISGIIAGTGVASSGRYRGIAPDAQILFDAGIGNGGTTPAMQVILEASFDNGARVYNNSWESALIAKYSIEAHAIDDFVYSHPHMVVTMAAGNHDHAGPDTLSALATAKNGIAVGATDNASVWSESATEVHDSSCRGPERFGLRVKPDIVAPGWLLTSTVATTDGYLYCSMGGTSQATAIVSGVAALIRQMVISHHAWQPSSCAVRAMIVAGATVLTSTSANRDHPKVPNNDQGFGLVNLAKIVTLTPSCGSRQFALWDVGVDDHLGVPIDPLLHTIGESVTFELWSDGSACRACLVWLEPAGVELQYQLILDVTTDVGTRQRGNENASTTRRGVADYRNNVLMVDVEPDEHVSLVTIDVTWATGGSDQGYRTRLPRWALAVAGNISTTDPRAVT